MANAGERETESPSLDNLNEFLETSHSNLEQGFVRFRPTLRNITTQPQDAEESTQKLEKACKICEDLKKCIHDIEITLTQSELSLHRQQKQQQEMQHVDTRDKSSRQQRDSGYKSTDSRIFDRDSSIVTQPTDAVEEEGGEYNSHPVEHDEAEQE